MNSQKRTTAMPTATRASALTRMSPKQVRTVIARSDERCAPRTLRATRADFPERRVSQRIRISSFSGFPRASGLGLRISHLDSGFWCLDFFPDGLYGAEHAGCGAKSNYHLATGPAREHAVGRGSRTGVPFGSARNPVGRGPAAASAATV